MLIHEDRLFPAGPGPRKIAKELYTHVRSLPFTDPATLLVQPDHYVFRMLYSQGISLDDLGIGQPELTDARKVWRIFAGNYFLFRGTPTHLWLDYVFQELFGLEERLSPSTADKYFDTISERLKTPEFLPRALYERFGIEVLSTTDSPVDSLADHQAIRDSKWTGRILPTFRPDPLVDPEFPGFRKNVAALGEQTGEDTASWAGYLSALRKSRARFRSLGCTATDHGHPTAQTADLSEAKAEELFRRIVAGDANLDNRELFRAQMLTEMAGMSLEDGLVMQIHPGSVRDHNRKVFERFGKDVGADIPQPTNYVEALRPLLDRFGNESKLTIILFTLDESTYSRELAPLAGHYPCLRLGPAWWFYDSPEGMMRYRELTTETAGFYNTVGFNDDTRAFLSIPARHDVARRVDCAFLAKLVTEHRLREDEAFEVAHDLAYGLAKKAYRL